MSPFRRRKNLLAHVASDALSFSLLASLASLSTLHSPGAADRDADESEHEYCWDSDFSDASLSDDSLDDEAEGGVVDGLEGGASLACQDHADEQEKEGESDADPEVSDEVAGNCLRSRQAVQCKSIRKLADDDQVRPSVSHVPSVEQIKLQLLKIQEKSGKRRQSQTELISAERSNLSTATPHAAEPNSPTSAPKTCVQMSVNSDSTTSLGNGSKTLRKVVTRPREQPPPP